MIGMKKLLEKARNLLPTRRKIIQLYCAVLFNANLKGYISGSIYKGNSKVLCAPGINCYSCPGAVGACPLGTLQGAISSDRSTIYYVFGTLLLYSIIFGRMICGWLCPFGLIQELLYKIKTPKVKKSKITRLLSYFKYVLLVFFVFIVPIVYAFRDTPLPAFCKYICPAGTIEGGLLLLANKVNASYFSMLGPIFTWKFVLMISIVVGSVFIFRLFCRFICPLGALYGLFNRLSFFGIKVEKSKCTNCNLCVNKCKMDIHKVGDQECISCGECVSVCPTQAITWKGPKVLVAPATDEKSKRLKKITRSISAILLAVLLIGAVVYYWQDANNSSSIENNTEDNKEYGTIEGSYCHGYDLPLVTGDGIQTETINPIKTGKVTIINFWGTWCTPCVNELPYFDQIATEYQGEISVIAVHTNLGIDKAPNYILEHYPDSNLIFAKDDGENFKEIYYSLLGGRDTYPFTVIIDEEGIILATYLRSVEYEDLKSVVELHLGH